MCVPTRKRVCDGDRSRFCVYMDKLSPGLCSRGQYTPDGLFSCEMWTCQAKNPLCLGQRSQFGGSVESGPPRWAGRRQQPCGDLGRGALGRAGGVMTSAAVQ